ncbi:hypothetical protein [Natrinema limicola]|uniref:Uncharacterized protein n=1 Tax=Natrinema limicola JCM 13563 TaxID=1230457 RepID=M0C6J2_9EURY|nr:hypothetical protein [Natrinema limicola]ELZ17519.1 hypothetical protein C476_15443 [Natrinema limicola JCM 13563]
MAAGRDSFRKPFQDLSNEEWIPVISIGLILVVFVISGLRYYFIDQAMTLLFYAVLVQIWTQVGGDLPLLPDRNLAYISFIITSIGAVSIGITMEWVASWITGDLIAAQSLALAVVISRIYINMRDSNASSPTDILRYREPVDRYLILIPCSATFLIPVIFYHLGIYYPLETRTRFFGLIVWSLMIGIFLYWYENEQ